MRILLVSGLVLGLCGSAWAWCETQPTLELQRACEGGAAYSQAAERQWYAEQRERDRQMQLEQSRLQAQGMAAFGSGNALIQGMNQGLSNSRIPPPPHQTVMPGGR